MRKPLLILLTIYCSLFTSEAWAQYVTSDDDNYSYYYDDSYSADSTARRGMNMGRNRESKKSKEVPVGLYCWNVVDDFGRIDSVELDTMPHLFQNAAFTDGPRGEYQMLGNMGSPRLSRLESLRSPYMQNYIFAEPYDYFLTSFHQIAFTNTLSPWTNLTYNKTGGSQTGEDRITALYAINSGKDIGLGFKLDYAYGRGYFDSQATSDFGALLYASVLKEQYKAHFTIYTNYLKTSENGGIESDLYVTNPESFASSYNTDDIPTRLDLVWNKMYVTGTQLTHSYSVGFRRLLPQADSIALRDSLLRVKPQEETINDSLLAVAEILPTLEQPTDSLPHYGPKRISIAELEREWAMGDEEMKDSLQEVQKPPTEFVPVTSFIHTLKAQSNMRRFIANEELSSFYSNKYFSGDSAKDEYSYLSVSNRVAIELHEGFNKWAVMGMRLFAQHEFLRYGMPVSAGVTNYETFNEISLGACLFRHLGTLFHYEAEAATKTDGDDWGQFYLKGNAELNLKLGKDTLSLKVYADIINQKPTYYYRTYNSTYLHWNNSLNKQFTTRIGGVLASPATHTRISLDVRNIKDYTYFTTSATALETEEGETTYSYNTAVAQASGSIQTLCLTLNQDFILGPLNWENQVSYQTSSDQDVLPLPDLTVYTNLYLLFRIAKVLRVEFGADLRYFTSYYAPTYSPAIGQFAVQDDVTRTKVGNHPVINVYANFHLHHTRFYIMASHVNYSKEGGNVFLAPHYPYNPFCIRFGLSWNFYN